MYQVSILVPIYNVELYIERCVRSLMEQTYKEIQYVFVDDCSPDSSITKLKEVIDEYPKRKSEVLIVNHEINRGLAAARNTAVNNATGDFVFHVDSDDYIEKDAIELLVYKQIESDADIVTGLALAEYRKYKSLLELREYSSMREMTLDMIKPSLRHTIWGRLIRKELYTAHSINAKEGINVGEDLQVMPCLSYYALKVANCYQLVYHYNCENENSYVHTTNEIGKCLRRGVQDVGSYLVVRDFFQDKDYVFINEAEKGISAFSQRLMGYYVEAKDRKGFENVRKIYRQLSCGHVNVKLWHKLHDRTFYGYVYCRLTQLLLPNR